MALFLLMFLASCALAREDPTWPRGRGWVEPARPGFEATQWVLLNAGRDWIEVEYDVGTGCKGAPQDLFAGIDERSFPDALVVSVFLRPDPTPNCLAAGFAMSRRIKLRHAIGGRSVFDGGQTPPRYPVRP